MRGRSRGQQTAQSVIVALAPATAHSVRCICSRRGKRHAHFTCAAPAGHLRTASGTRVVQAFTTMLDAAVLSCADRGNLVIFAKGEHSSSDDHGKLSALAAASIDVVDDLLDTAQAVLDGIERCLRGRPGRSAKTHASGTFFLRGGDDEGEGSNAELER